MRNLPLPTFDHLRRRFDMSDPAAGAAAERSRILRYLKENGVSVCTVGDVLEGVQSLDGEEELAAFKCCEGIAVTHASDGWSVLFANDIALD